MSNPFHYAVNAITERESNWMGTVIILVECQMALKIKSKIGGDHPLILKCVLISRFDGYVLSEVTEKILATIYGFLLVHTCHIIIILVFLFLNYVQLRDIHSEIKMLESDKRQMEVSFIC